VKPRNIVLGASLALGVIGLCRSGFADVSPEAEKADNAVTRLVFGTGIDPSTSHYTITELPLGLWEITVHELDLNQVVPIRKGVLQASPLTERPIEAPRDFVQRIEADGFTNVKVQIVAAVVWNAAGAENIVLVRVTADSIFAGSGIGDVPLPGGGSFVITSLDLGIPVRVRATDQAAALAANDVTLTSELVESPLPNPPNADFDPWAQVQTVLGPTRTGPKVFPAIPNNNCDLVPNCNDRAYCYFNTAVVNATQIRDNEVRNCQPDLTNNVAAIFFFPQHINMARCIEAAEARLDLRLFEASANLRRDQADCGMP
jgi:hypothetical protein